MPRSKRTALDLLESKETKIEYLDPTLVIDKRETEPPHNRSQTGYGNKIVTSWELKLKDKKWRRVYVIQWSNSGSAYIIVGNKHLYLGGYDPRY